MATITLSPTSTTDPNAPITVTGSGFGAKQRVRLRTDGYGVSIYRHRAERNGAFSVGAPPPVPVAIGTHKVEVLDDAAKVVLATATYQVTAVIEPPPPPPADTTPPIISALTVTDITAHTAVVKWVTSEPANSQVKVGPTTAYGTTTPLDTPLVLFHQVLITGLREDDPWNAQALSVDAAGNPVASSNIAFRTLPEPVIVPAPPPPGPGTVITLPSGSSSQQIQNALHDMNADTLMLAGVYPRTNMVEKALVRDARPLTIMPIAGQTYTFDGEWMSATPFNFGALAGAGTPVTPVTYLNWKGPFVIRRYNLGSTGLFLLGWYEHFWIDGLEMRECQGTGNQSHGIYLTSDSAHTSKDFRATNVKFGPFPGRSLTAFQSWDPDTARPNVDGVLLRNWSGSGVHRFAYLAGGAINVEVDNFDGSDADATFDNDSGSQSARGVIKNCQAVNSGPLAYGQNYWKAGLGLTDGGGNSWS